ncbi:hypothetical protein T07_9095 [Trichinella nelsoni]|uniref:Uncharacterized protein n=1 Tax=Trichinella nelsoni TaxID=6336 RepID=A0A0V0SCA3_9BILA|nr:hypothetical protein T07_9095 [Trichinella nelsoni]
MNYLERVFIFGAVAVGGSSLSLIINLIICQLCDALWEQIAIGLQEIKKKKKQTKAKMHNLQATLAHDSFGRVGDVQLTVVGRHAAFSGLSVLVVQTKFDQHPAARFHFQLPTEMLINRRLLYWMLLLLLLMLLMVVLFSKQHSREEKLPLKVIIVFLFLLYAWFVPDAAAKVDQTRRISNWPLSIKIIESAKQMQTQVKMSE